MGIIADRIARRKSPNFAVVLRLVQLLVREAGYDDTWDEMCDILQTEFARRTPAEFEQLRTALFEELRVRNNGEELMDVLQSAVEYACQYARAAAAMLQGTLVALPMSICHTDAAWNLPVPAGLESRLTSLLQDHDLVADDAQLSVLPRLLGALEADELMEGSVFRLGRALWEDAPAAALAAVDECNAHTGMAQLLDTTAKSKPTDGTFLSTGLLVFMLKSADPEPFPLSNELDFFLLEGAEEDADPEESGLDETSDAHAARQIERVEQAVSDLHAVLAKVAEALAPLLGVKELDLFAEPRLWFQGVRVGRRSERLASMLGQLRRAALAHTDGHIEDLCFGFPQADEPPVTFALYRKADLSPVGEVYWKQMKHEDIEECVEELFDLLAQQGVLSCEELEQARQAPAWAEEPPARRTRH
jgi:hypothetical protein